MGSGLRVHDRKNEEKQMNDKQQRKAINAITSILSEDWMSAEEISVKLKQSKSLDIDVDQVRRLLRTSNISEGRRGLGYRLPRQTDLIDRAILMTKDNNYDQIAKAFKVSRQAVYKRRKKLGLLCQADLIDKAILTTKDNNSAQIARVFRVSRQAVHSRRKKLGLT